VTFAHVAVIRQAVSGWRSVGHPVADPAGSRCPTHVKQDHQVFTHKESLRLINPIMLRTTQTPLRRTPCVPPVSDQTSASNKEIPTMGFPSNFEETFEGGTKGFSREYKISD
jgi:hypothetical protein